MDALNARSEITSLIQTVSKEYGIDNYVITDVKTNQKGEGYLGQIFMVSVKDPNNGKRLEMVIKASFLDEKIRTMVPIRKSFENEIHFYTNVYHTYEQFEKENGLSPSVHKLVPKCLKVLILEQEEILILENLKNAGFEIFDKKHILDEDHIRLIFKTYGKFHGYSFALRDQKPKEFARIAKSFYNIYAEFTNVEAFEGMLADVTKSVQNTLIPGEDDEAIKKFAHYAEGNNMMKYYDDIVTKEVDYPAILHGDCWSNNMMFKYEDTSTGKKPTDMRLIDWQLVKLGSPVCDLSYCLYSGASKEIFDDLDTYLKIYHDSFSSQVKSLGSDPEKLFPFSALLEEWKKYSKFGMIMAFQIIKMKVTEQEDIVDLTDGIDMNEWKEVISKQRFDEEGFNERVRHLVKHMAAREAL